MEVLSLFDGMSCGQIALGRSGIKVDNYFASEIKKHAIETTQLHYSKTIQVGDVCNLKSKSFPKIDLLIGVSPCQDFSQGNKVRAGLNGEKSKLFFEYVRLLNELNPKYFLLENVAMDEYSYNFISNQLGVYPININSSRVSAAFRNRYYWTNIGPQYLDLVGQKHSAIPQPKLKKIYFQDILESGYANVLKANSLNTHPGASEKNQESFWHRFNTTGMDNAIFLDESLDWRKGIRHPSHLELERMQTLPEGYTSHLTKNKAWNLIGDGWTIDVISHIFNYLK